MLNRKNSRCSRAQCITEATVGIVVIVSLVLFLLDVSVMVLAQSANDALAKHAARAAAEQPDSAKATQAVANVIDNFATSSIIPQKPTAQVTYTAGSTVAVKTTIQVKLLVPVPFVPSLNVPNFVAQSREPIISSLAM